MKKKNTIVLNPALLLQFCSYSITSLQNPSLLKGGTRLDILSTAASGEIGGKCVLGLFSSKSVSGIIWKNVTVALTLPPDMKYPKHGYRMDTHG